MSDRTPSSRIVLIRADPPRGAPPSLLPSPEELSKGPNRIEPLSILSLAPVATAIEELRRAVASTPRGERNWIAFTNRHAVEFAFEGLRAAPRWEEVVWRLTQFHVASMGRGTSAELIRRGLGVHLEAHPSTSRDLAAALVAESPDRVILARGTGATPELPVTLRNAGVDVREIAVYRARPRASELGHLLRLLQAHDVGALGFTSVGESEVFVRSLASRGLDPEKLLKGVGVATLGPLAAVPLRSAGVPTWVSPAPTVEALSERLVELSQPTGKKGER